MSQEPQEYVRERLYADYGRTAGVGLEARAGPGVSPYVRQFARRHLPRERNCEVLDLGCGEGHLLGVALSLGYRCLSGVDRSPAQVARARAAMPGVPIAEADALTYLRSLPPESKDVVVAFDVLEHLRRDELLPVLEEARRVLRPAGRLLVHTVNAGSPFFGRIRYGDLTHEMAFTATSLRQAFTSCGFGSMTFREDEPVLHGARSVARWITWKLVRAVLAVWLSAETGSSQDGIFSQGLVAVAYR